MENQFDKSSLPERNKLESQCKNVAIEFGNEGASQKFIELEGVDTHETYIASYLDETYHIDMAVRASKKLQEEGIKTNSAGGGFLIRQGAELYLYGQSTQLGKFNTEKVLTVLQKAYPDLTITTKD